MQVWTCWPAGPLPPHGQPGGLLIRRDGFQSHGVPLIKQTSISWWPEGSGRSLVLGGAHKLGGNTEAAGSGQDPPHPSPQWKPSPRHRGSCCTACWGGRPKPEGTFPQVGAPPCLQPPLPTQQSQLSLRRLQTGLLRAASNARPFPPSYFPRARSNLPTRSVTCSLFQAQLTHKRVTIQLRKEDSGKMKLSQSGVGSSGNPHLHVTGLILSVPHAFSQVILMTPYKVRILPLISPLD